MTPLSEEAKLVMEEIVKHGGKASAYVLMRNLKMNPDNMSEILVTLHVHDLIYIPQSTTFFRGRLRIYDRSSYILGQFQAAAYGVNALLEKYHDPRVPKATIMGHIDAFKSRCGKGPSVALTPLARAFLKDAPK